MIEQPVLFFKITCHCRGESLEKTTRQRFVQTGSGSVWQAKLQTKTTSPRTCFHRSVQRQSTPTALTSDYMVRSILWLPRLPVYFHAVPFQLAEVKCLSAHITHYSSACTAGLLNTQHVDCYKHPVLRG